LLGECIFFDHRFLEKDPRVRWLFAVFAVTIPFSAITAGKAGGAPNSLLPALLAMAAFCVLRLPRLFERHLLHSSPGVPLMRGALVAFLMLMSVFPHMSRSHGLFEPKNAWDREYTKVVRLVEKLPGTVMCPEDPTIPLYGKGYAGQNIFSEFDTHLVNGQWPTVPPAGFTAHCKTADYVVDVADYWQDLVTDDLLRSFGFEPVPQIGVGLECYRVWRRVALGPESRTSRTAFNESGRNQAHR
jgi:hypothetical protein